MENTAKFKILIVDDKPANLLAQQALLAKEDRQLYTAHNGNEALKMVLNNPPDLLLLDVHMPDMDGFEVARTIRQNSRTKDIPILFVTAEKKEHHSMMRGFEEGAVDYLFKPLDPEITQAKVSVLLKMQLQKKELLEKNRALEEADKQIKALNRELQKSMTSLEVSNKELEAFSYSVSHDLRTPLRAIGSFSSILLDEYAEKFDNEGKRILNVVIKNAEKMSEMVDKLLEFSKLGKKAIRKEAIDMGELVKNCVHELVSSMKHPPEIDIAALPQSTGDPDLVMHVWMNLIANAIKYSATRRDARIEIGALNKKNQVVYYIKDNGAGFDMAYASKLFGVFQRLHHPDEFPGNGVGLAVVQRIISKHGGKIWAEGEVGKGASFYFTLH